MTLEVSGSREGTEVRDPVAATVLARYVNINMGQMPDWDVETAIQFQYYANVYVYGAVRAIAQDIAALNFRCGLDPDDQDKYSKQCRLAQMLGPEPGSPNEEMSSTEFWQYTISQYLLSGAFCWEVDYMKGSSAIAGLWPLMIQYCRPIPSRDPKYYFSGVEYSAQSKKAVFNRDKALYHWKKSQRDIRQAESFLEAAKLDISVMVMQDRYDYSFLKNDARPAAVIVHEAFSSVAERNAWRQDFTDSHKGPENKGKVHWVEASEDGAPPKDAFAIQTLGLSQVDAEFIARYKQKINGVVVATGVPMSRLGDSSERTFSNADKEYEIYRKNVLIPLAKDLASFVNRRVAPRLGNEVGWFDFRPFELLERGARIIGVGIPELIKHKVIKFNEARGALGLMPDPDGDRYMSDEELALVQQGAAAILLKDPGIAHTPKDSATLEEPPQPEPGELAPPAPPPQLAPAGAVPADGAKPEPATGPQTRDARERDVRAAAREIRRTKAYKKFDAETRAREKRFKEKFDALLDRQLKIVLERLEGKRGRKMLAESRDKVDATGIFDKTFWEQATVAEFIDEYEAVFGSAAAQLFEQLGLALSFDINAPYVRDFIEDRANQLAGNVSTTTYEGIQAQLAEGAQAGESIPQLSQRIRNLFQQTYKNRAATVARTEVISAYNGSTKRQANEFGTDVVAAQEWIATPGTRTRHTHRAADEQLQLVGQKFQVGGALLEYPGDPSGPAKEVINCRCALGLLTPEEATEKGLTL